MAIKRPEIEVRQLLVGDWALILKKQRESPQKQISKEVTTMGVKLVVRLG